QNAALSIRVLEVADQGRIHAVPAPPQPGGDALVTDEVQARLVEHVARPPRSGCHGVGIPPVTLSWHHVAPCSTVWHLRPPYVPIPGRSAVNSLRSPWVASNR